MPPHWPPDRELVGGQPPADEPYIWVSVPGRGFGSGRTQVSCGNLWLREAGPGIAGLAPAWFMIAQGCCRVTELNGQGDKARELSAARDALLRAHYDEFRRVAGRVLNGDAAALKIQPTDLAHEAVIRLSNLDRLEFKGRTHFLSLSARVMRQIARHGGCRRGCQPRGVVRPHRGSPAPMPRTRNRIMAWSAHIGPVRKKARCQDGERSTKRKHSV